MNSQDAALFSVYRGKKVLVTGHTGFKGSWLCQWLVDLGAEVTGYSKDIPTRPSLFEQLELESEIRHIVGDVRDRAQFANVAKEAAPDFVFHLAAQPLVRASYEEPVETMATNVLGTVHVLDAFRGCQRSVCIVNITSDKCYENEDRDIAYGETDALGGSDPYSASKGAAEIVFASYFRSFFRNGPVLAVSARAGNVIGGGDYAEDRLVPDCLRAWSAQEVVSLRSPQSIRPWQHVLEPLSGYLRLGEALAAASPGVNGEAFNFGPLSDAFRPVVELVEGLQKEFPGARSAVLPQAERDAQPHEAKILKLGIEKAQRRLGWRPSLSFEEGLAWTAAWYRSSLEEASDLRALTREQTEAFGERYAASVGGK